MTQSPSSIRLRRLLDDNRSIVEDVLARYGASNPRLFGSVARGDANENSDIDLIVDIDHARGSQLMAVLGISETLREILGVRVDVVTVKLLREQVSEQVKEGLVSLIR